MADGIDTRTTLAKSGMGIAAQQKRDQIWGERPDRPKFTWEKDSEGTPAQT